MWREKLNLRPILYKYRDVDSFDTVTDEMRKDYADFVRGSQFLPQSLVGRLDHVRSVNDLNAWLDLVYNAADEKRVWVGAM